MSQGWYKDDLRQVWVHYSDAADVPRSFKDKRRFLDV